jgi:hypothetical protein
MKESNIPNAKGSGRWLQRLVRRLLAMLYFRFQSFDALGKLKRSLEVLNLLRVILFLQTVYLFGLCKILLLKCEYRLRVFLNHILVGLVLYRNKHDGDEPPNY